MARSDQLNPRGRYVVLMPVYEDWSCFHKLVSKLDGQFAKARLGADVLAVDDGSISASAWPNGRPSPFRALTSVRVLHLSRNLGHQRAIAVGLAYIEAHMPCRAVVVMDADGEDRPEDVVRLIEECEKGGLQRVVFALRTKRSEGITFAVFYAIYQFLFFVLTGQRIRMGNFSVVPAPLLQRLVHVSELWNHYVSAIIKSRLPHRGLDCPRGTRLDGTSHMSFVSLVTHGLSAISVFVEVVAARALIATGLITVLSLLLSSVVVIIRFATNAAIPGWATNAFGLGIVIFLQAITLSAFFAFLALSERSKIGFLPTHDHRYFVRKLTTLYPAAPEVSFPSVPAEAVRARRHE